MDILKRPVARRDNIVVQSLQDETLVYDLTNDKAYCLNATTAMIWEHCTGRNTIRDIAQELSVKTGSIITEEIIEFALEQLKKEGLLSNDPGEMTGMAGYSRREALKKIGFGSAIALPLVVSIVAPKAVNAQSCLGNSALRTCDPNGPGCIQLTPSIIRCPDAECCSGFCAIQPPNTSGNCVAGPPVP
ncbi:MAG: PqqD family peptide modification chaperone [Pyrinomonadaceae bacterium]